MRPFATLAETPWHTRVTIFTKAADLLAGKYRSKIVAATMIGQGKNVYVAMRPRSEGSCEGGAELTSLVTRWQAEIDGASETCDFFRWTAHFTEKIYGQQPPMHADGTWK